MPTTSTGTGRNPTYAPPAGMSWDATTNSWVPSIAQSSQYPTGSTTPIGNQNTSAANTTAAGASGKTGADYDVASTGATSYTNASQQGRITDAAQAALDAAAATQRAGFDTSALNQRAKIQSDAEARRLAALSTSFGGGQELLPKVGGSNIANDENAARAAAFGRAKDQAGQIARSALTAIQENVAGRGVAGGGIEALRTAGAIQGAQQPLQDLTREQYIQDLNRSSDISDQTYQGDITQRGQDVSQKNANRASLLALINNAFAPALY